MDFAPGDRLLAIACGTGILARIATTRLGEAGHIVGIALSPDMLAVAARMAPDIDWRDAAALHHRRETSCNLVWQQGVPLFPGTGADASGLDARQ